MSYPQFGYSYSTTPQLLMASNPLSTCCESGGRSLMEPGVAASPQTSLYCPVYESRLLASARHDLNPASAVGVYGNPYAKSQGYGTYGSYGNDTATTALYSLSKLDEKDGSATAHSGVTQTPTYYSYDHAFGQYQYDRYGYGSVDVSTRRKNATRETTSTLKAWLQEHKKNPYPTKGEKIMLAIITKMTLTQVSTWFANARRRLKKENKMTWSPRTKNSEEKGCDDDSDDVEGSQEEPIQGEKEFDENRRSNDTDLPQSDLEDFDLSDGSECELKPQFLMSAHPKTGECPDDHFKEPPLHMPIPEALEGSEGFSKGCLRSTPEDNESTKTFYHQQDHQQTPGTKPKIWSLAQTAISLNQTEYPSCMHRCQATNSPSPECQSSGDGADRQQDSPVATLRNWVDGVFHDPFRQITLNQAFSNPTVSWSGANGPTLENGVLGRPLAHVTSS